MFSNMFSKIMIALCLSSISLAASESALQSLAEKLVQKINNPIVQGMTIENVFFDLDLSAEEERFKALYNKHEHDENHIQPMQAASRVDLKTAAASTSPIESLTVTIKGDGVTCQITGEVKKGLFGSLYIGRALGDCMESEVEL